MAKYKNKPKRKRKLFNMRTFLLTIVMILYIGAALFTIMRDTAPVSGTVSYNELIELVEFGQVETIWITKDSDTIIVKKIDGEQLEAINPHSDTFVEDLLKRDANIIVQKTSATKSITNLLGTLPMMLIMAIFAVYISSTLAGGSTKQFTLLKTKDNHTTFNDIQGLSETKKEVQFIVEQMRNWKKLEELGARPCNGALLYGPPGTGKTLMAKAIAKEANVNFISCSGSDFNEMFVGVGAARVRQLWELAETNLPCIIFIDEIDCLGKRRKGGDAVVNELNQTLNCLLQKMDGINTSNGIMVIGATNRKEDLDDALLRPGRFDKHYFIGAPDNKKDRDEIVKIYLDTKKLSDDVTLDKASKLLVDLTGAEIENALNEAVYVSIQDGREGIIKLSDIDEAVMKRLTSGVKKEHSSKRDEQIVAYHEAGHTLISLLNNVKISKVSTIPYSSGMGGVTVRDLDEIGEIKLKLESDYTKDLKILLAGKIAEEIVFGEHTQGCSSDIEEATKIVYSMIAEWGFDKTNILNERILIENGLRHSLEVGVINRCNKTLKDIEDSVKQILTENRDLLEALASKLLEEKTIVCPTLEIIRSYKDDTK